MGNGTNGTLKDTNYPNFTEHAINTPDSTYICMYIKYSDSTYICMYIKYSATLTGSHLHLSEF